MKFSYNKQENIVQGNVIYNVDESTFDYVPRQFGDISILIGYLNLVFDSETRKACQVWGFNPQVTWIDKKLDKPIAHEGDLILEEDYEAGDNVRLINAGEWSTYYDTTKRLVCIGNEKITKEDVVIEFAKNILVALKDGNISSIWLQISG